MIKSFLRRRENNSILLNKILLKYLVEKKNQTHHNSQESLIDFRWKIESGWVAESDELANIWHIKNYFCYFCSHTPSRVELFSLPFRESEFFPPFFATDRGSKREKSWITFIYVFFYNKKGIAFRLFVTKMFFLSY